MPKLGDEIYGDKIGKSKRTKYTWVICKICNEEILLNNQINYEQSL